jgi:hypothetical protein
MRQMVARDNPVSSITRSSRISRSGAPTGGVDGCQSGLGVVLPVVES